MWYFAAGTCLTVLILPFFVTILVHVAVKLLVLVEKYNEINTTAASITDRPPSSPDQETEFSSEEAEGLATPVQLRKGRLTMQLKTAKYIEANMYAYRAIRRVDPKLFQSMNRPAVVMTFFSCTCYSLCLLACEYLCTYASIHNTGCVHPIHTVIMVTFQQDALCNP